MIIDSLVSSAISAIFKGIQNKIGEYAQGVQAGFNFQSHARQEANNSAASFYALEENFLEIDNATALLRSADDAMRLIQEKQQDLSDDQTYLLGEYRRDAKNTLSAITNYWASTGLMSSETLKHNVALITDQISKNEESIVADFEVEAGKLETAYTTYETVTKAGLNQNIINAKENIAEHWNKVKGDEYFQIATKTFNWDTGEWSESAADAWDPFANRSDITKAWEVGQDQRVRIEEAFKSSEDGSSPGYLNYLFKTGIHTGTVWDIISSDPNKAKGSVGNRAGALIHLFSNANRSDLPYLFERLNETRTKEKGVAAWTWEDFYGAYKLWKKTGHV
jgi:hypothetical protein